MSNADYTAISEAARRAGMTVNQFAAGAVLRGMRPEFKGEHINVLAALGTFQRIFCEAIELSIQGKLTVPRFRGIVERRSA